MASLTSSSRRSSSSYRSSSRYSTSSSYRSEGSLGGSSDSLDPLFEPFLDSVDHSSLFGEESPGAPSCSAPFRRSSRSSYGHSGSAGGAVTSWQSSTGGGRVHCLGDCYYMSANVSQFEPHDVVVMAYNHHVVVHAEKFDVDQVSKISEEEIRRTQRDGLCCCAGRSLLTGVLDDGSISDTFTHKSLFPVDMDPLSISGTINPDGTLVVSVRRTAALGGLDPLVVPTHHL